jgi:hypothetical protein
MLLIVSLKLAVKTLVSISFACVRTPSHLCVLLCFAFVVAWFLVTSVGLGVTVDEIQGLLFLIGEQEEGLNVS